MQTATTGKVKTCIQYDLFQDINALRRSYQNADPFKHIVFDHGECTPRRRVEEPVVLRVPEAAPVGRKPRLPHFVAQAGETNGRWEFECRPSFAGDRRVALITIDDRAVLDVQARGDANDAAVQVEARRLIDPGGVVVDHGIAPGSTA